VCFKAPQAASYGYAKTLSEERAGKKERTNTALMAVIQMFVLKHPEVAIGRMEPR